MLQTARPSLEHSFDPAQMACQTIILSADQHKLVLGGHFSRDENTDFAALAQIDTVLDKVDFAKTFSIASTISAIATEAKSRQIVVLANSKFSVNVYLLVIDVVNGDLIRALPIPTLANGSDTQQLRTAMIFIENERVLVGMGYESDSQTSIILHDTYDRSLAERNQIKYFLLSSRPQVIAEQDYSDGLSTRVYLGGQASSKAAISVLTLSEGQLASYTILELGQTLMIDEQAQVAHLYHDEKSLFGTTSIENLSGDTTQIGLWHIALDHEGLPKQGSVTKVFLTEGVITVTGILPSLRNGGLHMIIQKSESDQVYMIFDFVTGTIKNVVKLTGFQNTPFLSLLADMTSHIQAHFISTQNKFTFEQERVNSLYSASFEEEYEEENEDCKWNLLLESMHIEFMQQEALRFESLQQQAFGENTVEATQTNNFNEENENDQNQDHEEGDDESNDHSSSHESSIGDIRIYGDSDEEEEEEAKGKNKKRRKLGAATDDEIKAASEDKKAADQAQHDAQKSADEAKNAAEYLDKAAKDAHSKAITDEDKKAAEQLAKDAKEALAKSDESAKKAAEAAKKADEAAKKLAEKQAKKDKKANGSEKDNPIKSDTDKSKQVSCKSGDEQCQKSCKSGDENCQKSCKSGDESCQDPPPDINCVPIELQPLLTDQFYTITDNPKTYIFPPIVPPECNFVYTFTIADPAGGEAITFTGTLRQFTFFYNNNLTLSGNISTTYPITVQATDGVALISGTFNLTIKNPCIDSAFVDIASSVVMPKHIKYRLTDFYPAGLEIDAISLLSINTKPNNSNICMEGISYDAFFEGQKLTDVTQTTWTKVKTPQALKIGLYTDVWAMIGLHYLDVQAYLPYVPHRRMLQSGNPWLGQFPTLGNPLASQTIIEIISPCIDPNSITASSVEDPAPYQYSGLLSWELNSWNIVPNVCSTELVFSCANTDGPTGFNDLCAAGNFDTSSGNFSFQTIDKATYPPGIYTFVITGTVGSGSDSVTISVTIIDPCLTTQLSLEASFPALTVYTLRDPIQNVLSWNPDSILNKATPNDCGTPIFKFLNEDSSDFNVSLFQDARNVSGNKKFKVLYQDSPSVAGTYPLKLRAYFSDAPFNIIDSDTFKVKIIDPCDQPISVTSPSLTNANQVYTITQNNHPGYTIPSFIANPSWCTITYTYTIADISGESAVTFDATSRKFNFSYNQDLTLSGDISKDYVITVTGTAGNAVKTSTSSNFTLMIKNPCIDTDYVYIEPVNLLDLEYDIGTGPNSYVPHNSFVIKTAPITHTLCGEIAYQASYQGAPINDIEKPLAYASDTRTFTADSDNTNLIGKTHNFSVVATLTSYPPNDYPTVTSVTRTGVITFLDPCIDPILASTAQNGPAADKYTGSVITYTLNPFTITPAFCEISYSCDSVARQDGATSNIGCSDLTSAGTLFGKTGAGGSLTYSFDQTKYLTENYSPGIYVVTVRGTAVKSDPSISDTATYTFTLVDPCSPPTSLTKATLTDQEYTITDTAKTYTHPEWTIDPSYCPLIYDYDIADITNVANVKAISRTNNVFSIYYDANLQPLGQTETVTITATSGSIYNSSPQTKSASASWDLSFNNPCTNTAFVSISAPVPASLTAQTYIVSSTAKTWAQSAFSIVTSPISHSLCGDLSYTAKFDGSIITNSNRPVSYQEVSATSFTVQTDNLSYVNTTKPYTVIAEFANWPKATNQGADQKQVSGTIEFQDPCLNLFSFAATAQTDMQANKYTGALVTFTLTQFTVTPSSCANTVTYAITNVVAPIVPPATTGANFTTKMGTNAAVPFDGIFNGQVSDGIMKHRVTEGDYSSNPKIYPPGDYTYTITATTASGQKLTANFKWTLINPCSPPDALSVSTSFFAPLPTDTTKPVFTIGQSVGLKWQYPVISTPSYCTLTKVLTVTPVDGGLNSINPVTTLTGANLGSYQASTTITPDILQAVAGGPRLKQRDYNVTFIVTSGVGIRTQSFILTIQNPCLDTSYMTFTGSEFSPIDYVIGSTTVPVFYGNFRVVSNVATMKADIPAGFCGQLVYWMLKYEGVPIEDETRPVFKTLDPTDQTLNVFSEDMNLAGTIGHYAIEVRMESYYPAIPSIIKEGIINYHHPCDSPEFSNISTALQNVGVQPYDNSWLTYKVDRFIVVPSYCTITYSCNVYSQPNNLSQIPCNGPYTSFDQTKGELKFGNIGIDKFSTYKPGDYIYTMTGVAGIVDQKTSSFQVKITLKNLCATDTTMTLTPKPSSMTSKTYILGNPAIQNDFDITSMYTLSPNIDCGIAQLQFLNSNKVDSAGNYVWLSQISTLIFSGFQSWPFAKFKVVQQNTYSTIGSYQIDYQIFLKDYNQVNKKYTTQFSQPAFSVKILPEDYCSLKTPPTAIPFTDCPRPTDSDSIGDPAQLLWMYDIPDFTHVRGSGDQILYLRNPTGPCEREGVLPDNIFCSFDIIDLYFDQVQFIAYNTVDNTLEITDGLIEPIHNGQWLFTLGMYVNNPQDSSTTTYFKSFVINIYYEQPTLVGASLSTELPMLTSYQFGGTVLDSPPSLVNWELAVQPFISEVTQDGVVEFGFPQQIETTSTQLSTNSQTAIRELSAAKEVILIDKDNAAVYKVYDTISIVLQSSEQDDKEPVKVDWTLIDFNGEIGHLQMNLENLQTQKIDLQTYDSLQITFNDAIGQLKTSNDKQVNFGEKLDWKLPPLVSKNTYAQVESIGNLWLSLICIGIAIALFLAIFKGSLVSTWIFINSLQLIAHVPLISEKMPANANYFFLKFMGIARLNIESFNCLLDTVATKLIDYQLIEDEKSFFTAELHSYGYRFSFVRNLLTVLCITALIGLVWILSAVVNQIRKKIHGAENSKNASQREVYMNNFMVRFLLEIFFELMICAMINIASQAESSKIWWLLSLFTLVAGAIALFAVGFLFFKRGPYVRDTYAPASLIDSYWGVRCLHEDIQRRATNTLEDQMTVTNSKKKGEDDLAISGMSPSKYADSDVPLNQMFAAVDLKELNDLMMEGGETERGLTTERSLVTKNASKSSDSEISQFGQKIQKEAQLRQRLEDSVQVNGRFKTLFEGLKLNQPHNSAVTYQFAFMIRRLIYAVAISFMTHMPQIATLVILSLSMAMLAFILVENPWKNPEHQKLEIVNEIFIYVILLLLLSFSCQESMKSAESEAVGWMLISLFILFMQVNLVFMIAEAYLHCKLLYARHINQRKLLLKKSQVAPLGAKQETEQQKIEVIDMAMRQQSQPDQSIGLHGSRIKNEVIQEVSSLLEELSINEIDVEEPKLLTPIQDEILLQQIKEDYNQNNSERFDSVEADINALGIETGSEPGTIVEQSLNTEGILEVVEAEIIVFEIQRGSEPCHIEENAKCNPSIEMKFEDQIAKENPEESRKLIQAVQKLDGDGENCMPTISCEMSSQSEEIGRLESLPDNYVDIVGQSIIPKSCQTITPTKNKALFGDKNAINKTNQVFDMLFEDPAFSPQEPVSQQVRHQNKGARIYEKNPRLETSFEYIPTMVDLCVEQNQFQTEKIAKQVLQPNSALESLIEGEDSEDSLDSKSKSGRKAIQMHLQDHNIGYSEFFIRPENEYRDNVSQNSIHIIKEGKACQGDVSQLSLHIKKERKKSVTKLQLVKKQLVKDEKQVKQLLKAQVPQTNKIAGTRKLIADKLKTAMQIKMRTPGPSRKTMSQERIKEVHDLSQEIIQDNYVTRRRKNNSMDIFSDPL